MAHWNKTGSNLRPIYTDYRLKLERRRKLGLFTTTVWIISWIIFLSLVPLFRHVMINSYIRYVPVGGNDIDFRYENVIQFGHPGKRYPTTIKENEFDMIFNHTMNSPLDGKPKWAPPSTIFVNWPMEVQDKAVVIEDFITTIAKPFSDEL